MSISKTQNKIIETQDQLLHDTLQFLSSILDKDSLTGIGVGKAHAFWQHFKESQCEIEALQQDLEEEKNGEAPVKVTRRIGEYTDLTQEVAHA